MLKCFVDSEQEKIVMEADGDMHRIVTDLCYMTNRIYTSLHEQDKEEAEVFRLAMGAAMIDPESPIWAPDTSKERRAVTTCVKVPKK